MHMLLLILDISIEPAGMRTKNKTPHMAAHGITSHLLSSICFLYFAISMPIKKLARHAKRFSSRGMTKNVAAHAKMYPASTIAEDAITLLLKPAATTG